jgi:hypothetical protein
MKKSLNSNFTMLFIFFIFGQIRNCLSVDIIIMKKNLDVSLYNSYRKRFICYWLMTNESCKKILIFLEVSVKFFKLIKR